MEKVTLKIDNAPAIRFTGERVASARSAENLGCWAELALYQTKRGKYICHSIMRTIWDGGSDQFDGKTCQTLEEVKEFFGHDRLAKELYSEASIDDSVEVE